jgi:hypothetical protein
MYSVSAATHTTFTENQATDTYRPEILNKTFRNKEQPNFLEKVPEILHSITPSSSLPLLSASLEFWETLLPY